MEAGNLLKQMMYLVIPIVAIIVFISIAWNFSGRECKLNIGGSDYIILGNFRNCVENCWNKHDFGNDIYVDDCFAINVATKNQLNKDMIESYTNGTSTVKAYFDFLAADRNYIVKVRYNSTGKEISLIRSGEVV